MKHVGVVLLQECPVAIKQTEQPAAAHLPYFKQKLSIIDETYSRLCFGCYSISVWFQPYIIGICATDL